MNNTRNNHSDSVSPPQKTIEPKKFLFVSLESLSGDLAWSLTREGHQVKAYIRAKSDIDVYDGFLEKVNAWEPHKDWADVIVFDDVGFGMAADKLRKQGKLVIGGSVYTDNLEIDREFGQHELKKYGVNTLASWQFSDHEGALSFIRNNPGRYVYKPSGNTPSGGKGLLLLGQEDDGSDLVAIIEKNKVVWQKRTPLFLIQKFISGVEVAVGAFFNGKNFIPPININFEHKRVFPGNIGPLAGEMGTLMYWSQPNSLFQATLEKMLPALRESGYIGYIDINCVVNGKGIYPLEFTSRFGYPTIHIQLEGILTPTGEWLYNLAKGDNFELKTKRGFQIGVRILVPSYFSNSDNSLDVKTYHDLAVAFKRPNLEGIHIEDIKNDNGIWRIAGTSGCILVVTGSGTTVEEARHLVYRRIKNIMIPDMFYRTDIGSSWASNRDKLYSWGYL